MAFSLFGQRYDVIRHVTYVIWGNNPKIENADRFRHHTTRPQWRPDHWGLAAKESTMTCLPEPKGRFVTEPASAHYAASSQGH
jgi:hypothetical protein